MAHFWLRLYEIAQDLDPILGAETPTMVGPLLSAALEHTIIEKEEYERLLDAFLM